DDLAWYALQLPAMVMTGSNDRSSAGQSRGWRREGYQYMPPRDKYLLCLKGANHLTFAALRDTPYLRPMREASLLFWNAYLENDSAARTALQSETLEKSNPLVVQDER